MSRRYGKLPLFATIVSNVGVTQYPNFPAAICIDTKPVDIAVRGKR